MAHLYCTDLPTSLALMAIKKSFSGMLDWKEKGSNAGFIIIQLRPEYADEELGGTIPGVAVTLEYRIPQSIPHCKYTFTLVQIKGGVQLRAYQIEVVPRGQISSREKGVVIKGPHEHIGHTAAALTETHLEDDFQVWFELFCRKINLTLSHAIPNPAPFVLSLKP